MNITLKAYQKKAHEHLLQILQKQKAALDASDTGTGKTYVALQVVKDLGRKPLIICPKSVISMWAQTAQDFGIKPLDIVTIELIRRKTRRWLTRMDTTQVVKQGQEYRREKVTHFKWNLPPGSLIILDEAHKIGGTKTLNARALAAARLSDVQVLALSATIADSPLRLRALGYLLKLHNWADFWDWCLRHGCNRNQWNGIEFNKFSAEGKNCLQNLHHEIFPGKGVRVRIKDIPDFPSNTVIAEALNFEPAVRRAYEDYETQVAETDQLPIVAWLRMRQLVETLKAPIMAEMITEYLDENKSVVFFACYLETIELISKTLEDKGIAYHRILGGQSDMERRTAMREFQENKVPVILATIQAGGESISLHDINGRPRVSVMSPPASAQQLVQALGRIHRAGARSPAVQKIVFAAGTPEEQACRSVKAKINNLSLLTDGELCPEKLENL